MRGRAASITGRRHVPWLRKYGFAVHLGSCFLLVTLAVVFVDLFERNGTGGDLIWVANGLLLAYLLLAPRWRWPAYLLTGFLALLFGSKLIHETWGQSLFYNLLDIGEVLMAALLLRRRSTQLPRFTDLAYLLRFIVFAILAAPMATGLIYAWVTWLRTNVYPPYAFLRWAGADGLGIAVITPICVAIFQSDFRERRPWRQRSIYLMLTAVIAAGAFSQNSVPLVFLIYPLLVLLSLRVDLGSAALAMLEVTAVGSWFTIRGEGPFHAQGFVNPVGPNILLQLFIIAGIFILFSISVVQERQKATERKLQEIVSLHRLVGENSRDVIIVADFDGKRSYVSSAAQSMGGWKSEDIIAFTGLQLVHPDDLHKAKAAVAELRSGSEGAMVECRVRKANGEYIWVEAALRLIRDPKTGKPSGILNTVRDISERKATEQKLQEIVTLHKLVTENSRDAIILSDFNGKRIYVSSASETMFGWTLEEMLKIKSTEWVHPEDLPRLHTHMNATHSGVQLGMLEYRVRKKNGEYVWVEANVRMFHDPATGLPSGNLILFRDISERKRSEQQLREAYHAVEALALTDGLTGLANRRRFDQYLSTEWRRNMRNQQPLSLIMLDVDLFKMYNDTYGHQCGDSCLKQIAEACMDVVSRPGDLVARFGGEEIVVALPNTESEGARQVANEICESLRGRRLPHTGSPFGIITISAGCATLVPQAGLHAPDLIAIADHALYAAKSNGRNQVCIGSALEKHGEDAAASTLPEPAASTTA